MESSTASRVYIVGTLLRTFVIALYGGQTSNYFSLGTSNPEMFLTSYSTLIQKILMYLQILNKIDFTFLSSATLLVLSFNDSNVAFILHI